MNKGNKRYSEAFKRQVVEEMESGKFASIRQAQKAYGITGAQTVTSWVGRLGSPHIQPRIIRIETMKERDELKELKKRNRDLEAALADAHLEHVMEKAYLHVACERMGEDPDDFKKKHAMTLCELRKKGYGAALR